MKPYDSKYTKMSHRPDGCMSLFTIWAIACIIMAIVIHTLGGV